jgi:hypothetical protein
MAAHLRPRVQATTDRKGRSEQTRPKPAAVKCSGLLGGEVAESAALLKEFEIGLGDAKIAVRWTAWFDEKDGLRFKRHY